MPRYRIRLTRIQTAERNIRASDEDHALEKVHAEAAQPYGLIGAWKTTTTDADVISVEPTEGVGAKAPDGTPLLLSIKDAATHLGIPRNQLYELVNAGEMEHLRIGRRMYISRDALAKFIESNAQSGYHPHRLSRARTLPEASRDPSHRRAIATATAVIVSAGLAVRVVPVISFFGLLGSETAVGNADETGGNDTSRDDGAGLPRTGANILLMISSALWLTRAGLVTSATVRRRRSPVAFPSAGRDVLVRRPFDGLRLPFPGMREHSSDHG